MGLKQLLTNSNIAEMTYKTLWNDYLIKWRVEHDKDRPIGDFHASALADKNFCIVKAVIDEVIKKKDDPFAPETLAVFVNGIDVHKKHQKFLKDIGAAIRCEDTYYSEFLDMYATPDNIITFLNKPTIVEIKSMRSGMFNGLKEVPYNAFCQAQVYMYMTGIPNAIVVVENKDDQRLKIYELKFDLKFAFNLIKHRLRIMECVREKHVPIDKRICAKPIKRCKYSEYCFSVPIIKKIEAKM